MYRSRSFPCLVLAAMTWAISSCALFEAVHPELPEVQPVQSPAKGPLVGLREVVDARSDTTIGLIMGKPEQDKRVIVGSEVVGPATAMIANHVAGKGYRVVRTPFQAGAGSPSRVVVAVLTSLDVQAAELDVSIDDLSGHALFRQTYSGNATPFDFGQFMGYLFSTRFGMGDKVAAKALSGIDVAAGKMCSDPAFIAALTPTPVTTPAAQTK